MLIFHILQNFSKLKKLKKSLNLTTTCSHDTEVLPTRFDEELQNQNGILSQTEQSTLYFRL